MDLTKISSPSFLKSLDNEQLKELSEDIRSFLIEKVIRNRWTYWPEFRCSRTYNCTS